MKKLEMKKLDLYNAVPLAGLVGVIIVFAILTNGKLISVTNMKTIFDQSLVLCVAGLGVTFVMTTGGLDFSQGSMLAVCCIVGVYAAKVSFVLAALACIALGGLIGLINGLFVTKLKIQSFIVTICMMCILRGVNIYSMVDTGAVGAPLTFSRTLDTIWIKILVLAVVIAIAVWLFNLTRFGRNCRAVGSGELAAIYSGVPVGRIRILVFTIAGLFCGIAAYMMIIRTGTATPQTGNLMETDILTALVLGGFPITGGSKSRIWCCLVGAFMLSILSNGLTILGANSTTLQLVKGLIFLAAVAVSLDRKSAVVVK